MPKSVIWSPASEKDFANILDYLGDNWSDVVALTFIEIVERILSQISINPKQYPVIYAHKKIRKCVITKHNSLFYREKKKQVELLRIYDTRQDPKKLVFV